MASDNNDGMRDQNLPRHFFVTEDGIEREVSLDEFCRAEARAGFKPKPGLVMATAGFSRAGLSGRVEY